MLTELMRMSKRCLLVTLMYCYFLTALAVGALLVVGDCFVEDSFTDDLSCAVLIFDKH